MKTEGCRVNTEEHYDSSISYRQNEAAVTIQRIFRGYITRKYIDEARYLISKAITLQRWWRSVLEKRRKKIVKPFSIENSLITIKDFNETMKADKGGRMFSDSKENTLSTHKLNMKDLIKNILEE